MIAFLKRLWRAIRRELLLGDIVAYEERLAMMLAHGLQHYDAHSVNELLGTLAALRARLRSAEFTLENRP